MKAEHPQTPRAPVGWTIAALGLLAFLATLDGVTGEDVILTGTFVLAPLALAVVGPSRFVAVVAALAFTAGVVSGFWNDFAFSEDHVVRLTVIAVGGTLAVLGAVARRSAEEDRTRMGVLAALARMSEATSLEEVLERVADETVPALADLVWIDLRLSGEQEPRRLLTRARGPRANDIEAWLRSRGLPPSSPTRAALDLGKPVFVADFGEAEIDAVSEGPDDRARIAALDLRSYAIVPLRAHGETIGTLGLAAGRAGRRYGPDDVSFFEVMAGRVALALTNARLVAEVTSTRERLDRILDSLAEAVTVHDDTGKTVYANEAAVELLGARDLDEVLAAGPGELSGRFLITREDGAPVTEEDFPGRKLVAGEPSPPPILTRSVHIASGREYWILTKATLVRDTDGGALAVNVLEDVTEAKDAELRQRFLDEAGQALASTLEYEQALQRVASLAVPWLADWCGIDLLDPRGGTNRVAIAHSDPAKVEMARDMHERYPPDPDAPTGLYAVLRTGTPELYPDIPDELLAGSVEDAEHLELLRAVGMRAVMIVPMTAGDEIVGAMSFVSAESGRTFGDDDFAFAQDLARRAATAVQNGRLYAEQSRVAQTLQRSLLPDSLPEVPGWEAGASYVAGDDRSEVGGDFYDIVATRRGHLVILGDVTGKGVEAAALTALVRHSAQTAARFDLGPAEVVELVDGVLREQAALAPVSMVCALIEDVDGAARVTISSGGHPLPLLRRGGEAREVGDHDVLLGVAPGGQWREHVVDAEPGDALLFYTDGVIDAPGPAERFGERRLNDVVAAAPPEPAAIIAAIDRALREFGVTGGADDRAMLVLRYAGQRTGAAGGALAGIAIQ